MIQVQIASQITAHGLCGVRWVLVEAVDGAPREQVQQAEQAEKVEHAAPAVAWAAQAAAAPVLAPPGNTPMADSLRLVVLKAVVVALGLGAALWTAAVQVGAPGGPGPAVAPGAAPQPQPQPQPQPAAQGLVAPVAPAEPAEPSEPSEPAEPAASAPAGGLPRLTAAL